MRKSRRGGLPTRQQGTKEVLPTILIVTEGMKTEPNYFNAFPVSSLTVRVVGCGRVTSSLVDEAERLNEQIDADITWCVFDYDDIQDFDKAVKAAKNKGFKVAHSVESFELWYLLHFNYLDAQLKRDEFCKRLSTHIGVEYEKNSRQMYAQLLDRQAYAIKSAKRLEKHHDDLGINQISRRNPSTHVYRLVEELNQYIKH